MVTINRKRLGDDTFIEEKTVEELREEGHLIIIWTPEELGNVDADALEDYVISKGNDYIQDSN